MDPIRQRWRELLAPIDARTAANDAAWRDGDAPAWRFHALRPAGDGVEAFFPSDAAGRAAASRLRRVLRAAPSPPEQPYLIPARRDAREERVVSVAREHLLRMRALVVGATVTGEVEGDDPGLAWLRPDEVALGEAGGDEAGEARGLLHTLAAWRSSRLADPHAAALREPLYGLACSHELAGWVLAPLTDADADPFAPWAWLWRHGRSLRFERAGARARVVVTR